ncbi:MAG: tetratricopeptide repeat protein [Planctomycetales bacterium]|nr:tetratricopeptide repeat protein [Planctomycetales bacterium]
MIKKSRVCLACLLFWPSLSSAQPPNLPLSALDAPAESQEAIYKKASLAIAQEQYPVAIAALEELHARFEGWPPAQISQLSLAECLAIEGRWDDALQVTERWLEFLAKHSKDDEGELLEDYWERSAHLVQILCQQRDSDTCAKKFLLLAAPQELRFSTANLCGEQHFQRGRYELARSWLATAFELAPEQQKADLLQHIDYDLPLVWASKLYLNNQPKQALELLRTLELVHAPVTQRIAIWFLQAEILATEHQNEAASRIYIDLLALAESLPIDQIAWMPTVQLRLAGLFVIQKRYAEARSLINTALSDDLAGGADAEMLFLLARIQVAEIQLNQALETLTTILASNNNSAEHRFRAQWMSGEVNFLKGNHAQAIVYYNPVCEQGDFPHWQSQALLQRAKCHELLGNQEAALADYELLVERFPKSEPAAASSARLAVIKPSVY